MRRNSYPGSNFWLLGDLLSFQPPSLPAPSVRPQPWSVRCTPLCGVFSSPILLPPVPSRLCLCTASTQPVSQRQDPQLNTKPCTGGTKKQQTVETRRRFRNARGTQLRIRLYQKMNKLHSSHPDTNALSTAI